MPCLPTQYLIYQTPAATLVPRDSGTTHIIQPISGTMRNFGTRCCHLPAA